MVKRKTVNWQQFTRTRYGSLLVKFFLKLNSEMTQFNDNPLKRDTILILNTKKGYWMYKVFEQEMAASPVELYSDEYVKKVSDVARLSGKIIYLLDDTLTFGFSLLKTYKRLVEIDSLKEADICPLVFALNERVNVEKEIANAQGTEVSFWSNLKYFVQMSAEELSEFCVQETLLLHNQNVPYVTNLPYLKQENKEKISNRNYEVVLKPEQFKTLQQSDGMWKFHLNSYQVEEINYLQGFIIQYCDKELIELTQDFVFDYAVEGTYYEDEEECVHLVFVPFVIEKSVAEERVEETWKLLVGGGSDSESAKISMQERHRECVFVFGMLLANQFIAHLRELTGISLEYDFDILSEHYTKAFVDKMRELGEALAKEPDFLYRKLKRLQSFSAGDAFVCNAGGREYSVGESFGVVLEQIHEKKVNYLRQKGVDDAILQVEDIEKLLDRTFCFSDEEMRRYALTNLFITFIQSSICGSQLFVDENCKMIKVGARYGENSDLALPFFNRYFYWAVILMAERVGEESLRQSYDRFVQKLREEFQVLGLWNMIISESDFARNAKYYKMVLENEFQLNNKLFYLNDFMHGETGSRENGYMNEIEEFVLNFKG